MAKATSKLFADALFVLHCMFGVFILCGWAFPNIFLIYILTLIVWVATWVFLGYCPITRWEFMLRRKQGVDLDPNEEVIQHYMYKFFHIRIPTKAIFIGGLIVAIMGATLAVITKLK